MNDAKICVLGGANFLGREICRLAVAMGHGVISVAPEGRPEQSAPWLEGVEWVSAEPDQPDTWRKHAADCEAIIDCYDTFDSSAPRDLDRAKEADSDSDASRYVYVSTASVDRSDASPADADSTPESPGEATLASIPGHTVVLRPGPIDQSRPNAPSTDETPESLETAASDGVERERVAIAALRAALEPNRSGVFEAAEVAHLGDAMFIQ